MFGSGIIDYGDACYVLVEVCTHTGTGRTVDVPSPSAWPWPYPSMHLLGEGGKLEMALDDVIVRS